MVAVLLVAQSLAAVILGAVGLFQSLQKPMGGPNRSGYMVLGLGAAVFVAATVSVQLINDAETEREQRRIEQLLDRLFLLNADRVMATPKEPPVPVLATVGAPIAITNPRDDSEVDQRQLIEGIVADPSRDVWIVVHPLDTSSYWIQQRVSVRSGGTWRVMAYFGRSGDIDKRKKFEVVAVAGPRETLQEGEYRNTWPKAEWTSEPIVVIRR